MSVHDDDDQINDIISVPSLAASAITTYTLATITPYDRIESSTSSPSYSPLPSPVLSRHLPHTFTHTDIPPFSISSNINTHTINNHYKDDTHIYYNEDDIHTHINTTLLYKDDNIHINQYTVKETIGNGNFSTVKLIETQQGNEFALKTYYKSELSRRKEFKTNTHGQPFIISQLDEVHREMQMMREIKHPRCLKCYEILEAKENDGKLCIVVDYLACGSIMHTIEGQFYTSSHTQPLFSEEIAKCIIRDVSEGLTYLHDELNVAHRDIKPENILLDSDGRAKIGDFGLAEHMDARGRVRSTKGTYFFMSPECVELPKEGTVYEGHDGRAADIWGLGITLWVMLYGELHHPDTGLQELFDQIINFHYQPPTTPILSKEGHDLLQKMLCKQWGKRITAKEVLNHPWITSADYTHSLEYVQSLLKQLNKS